METETRDVVTELFNILAIWLDGYRIRNISGKYIIIYNPTNGQEFRIDVTPYIDMTEVSE